MRIPNAAAPSASTTSFESVIVAKIEPSATVTTKPKALIYLGMLLPETRSISTSMR